MARINIVGAAEIGNSRPTSPITATFMRAGEVDPRRKGGGDVRAGRAADGAISRPGRAQRSETIGASAGSSCSETPLMQ